LPGPRTSPDADRPATLTIGHSPDADDVFMWWPLQGKIDTGPWRFQPVAEDIETLNRRAADAGDLDITALSIHAYPSVKERYALTACGGSMGDGYGPKVVAREASDDPIAWLRERPRRVATPGARTTAALTFSLMARGVDFEPIVMSFEEVIPAVAAGDVDAGLVIHEGQLTYTDAGLSLLIDLGAWWKETTRLPLPLGGNAVRRDLDERFGAGATRRVAGLLEESIRYAMADRATGLRHALEATPHVGAETTDRFVAMYVNDLTVGAGERGREAIQTLLDRGAAAGLCPAPGRVDLVRGG